MTCSYLIPMRFLKMSYMVIKKHQMVSRYDYRGRYFTAQWYEPITHLFFHFHQNLKSSSLFLPHSGNSPVPEE